MTAAAGPPAPRPPRDGAPVVHRGPSHPPGWTRDGLANGDACLVIATGGGWLERGAGTEAAPVDALSVSFRSAGAEIWVRHTGGHDDAYEVVRLARGAALPASLRTVRHATALLSVESVLAHGDLLAARRAAGPEAVLADRLARLTAALSRDLRAAAERGAEPTASQRRLAERIRLGAAAAASRSHTSRAFHHATGETLSGYRRRLRVAAAVRAIASGDDVFARVAAEAGFADHAHLSRTLLAATGSTPTQLRRRFRAGAGQG